MKATSQAEQGESLRLEKNCRSSLAPKSYCQPTCVILEPPHSFARHGEPCLYSHHLSKGMELRTSVRNCEDETMRLSRTTCS
jgi:hypothetical protein